MSATELFPAVHALQHADKFRLMEFLLRELAQEEGISLNEPQANNAEAIDALQILSSMALPLGPEDLAQNFDRYVGISWDGEADG